MRWCRKLWKPSSGGSWWCGSHDVWQIHVELLCLICGWGDWLSARARLASATAIQVCAPHTTSGCRSALQRAKRGRVEPKFSAYARMWPFGVPFNILFLPRRRSEIRLLLPGVCSMANALVDSFKALSQSATVVQRSHTRCVDLCSVAVLH